jgi:hypothetical protein
MTKTLRNSKPPHIGDFDMPSFTTTGDPLIDIPALIKSRGDGLTFVELLQHIPYLNGNFVYGTRDTNIVYWNGVSEQCIKSLADLVDAGIIRRMSTLPLTYLIDGIVPNLPLAKSIRKYKKPHWAPITFSLLRKAA